APNKVPEGLPRALLTYFLWGPERSILVPGERIELPTNGLQNRCSTAELTRLELRATSLARPPQADPAHPAARLSTIKPPPPKVGAPEWRGQPLPAAPRGQIWVISRPLVSG